MFNEFIDKKTVLEHLKKVIEEKTNQLTDHVINRRTLENKIKTHQDFSIEQIEKMEIEIKGLAGKDQKQYDRAMLKLAPQDREIFQKYVNQKRDLDNFEFSERGIREHNDFLRDVVQLKNEIETQNSTSH